jgi:hypothetical protein
MAFDPFALDESASEDGFQGVITNVEYKTGEYGFDAVITTKHDEPRKKNDGTLSFERPVFMRVAGPDQGFVAIEDGKGFSNPSDPDKRPRDNSAYGRFIKRLKKLAADSGQTLTSIEGTWARWELEGAGKERKEFTNKTTGEVIPAGETKGYYLPVEIRTGASANGAVKADFDLSTLRDAGMTPVIESDLAKDAKASATPQEFLARAVTHDDVKSNNAIVGALADPGFFETLKAQ